MYLHLGGDTVIKTENIVGIFDMENTSVSKHTKKYLGQVQKDHKVVNVSMELPKSFIVCFENGVETVYISQISPATLIKRLDYIRNSDVRNIKSNAIPGKESLPRTSGGKIKVNL